MKYFNYRDFEGIGDRLAGLSPESREQSLCSVDKQREKEVSQSQREAGQWGQARAVKRRSDPLVSSCIREYERQCLETAAVSAERTGTVHAVPKLIWEDSSLRLELTVGEERQYVVRNLLDFCMAMEQGGRLRFGKQFSLQCLPEVFHQDSIEFVNFIMKQYLEVKELERLGYGFSGNSFVERLFAEGKRAMNLTSRGLDELFQIYNGQSVSLQRRETSYRRYYAGYEQERVASHGFDRRVYIKEDTPLLSILLEEAKGGVELQIRELPLVMKGEEFLYLYFESSPDCLWRCGREYRQGTERLLSAMKQGRGRLFVADKDMARFCAGVLPAIRPFTEFCGATGLLERWEPSDMEAGIYLDSPSRDVIMAVAQANYGTAQINLYNGEEAGVPLERGQGAEGERESLEKGRSANILRNSLQEQKVRNRLENWFHEMDEETGALYMRGDDQRIYDFLKHGQRELSECAQIFVTDRYRRLAFSVKTKTLVRISLDSQLLKVTFDFEGFPVEELLDALSSYRAKRRYHRLSDGAFLNFEEKELQDALEFVEGMRLTTEELAKGAVRIPKYRAMYLERMMKRMDTIRFDRDEAFGKLLREIRNIGEEEEAVPPHLEPVLRDYQKTGFRWLRSMARLGFGGILADDMGLGKTLEVIALLTAEAEKTDREDGQEQGRVLAMVVCPASLVLNWEQEILRFAPGLTPYPVWGAAGERKRQIEGLKKAELCSHSCVVITSYDLLKRDIPLYEGVSFLYHILDEAQYIKNFSTQNAKAVKGIRSLRRFALTGTPVENRLSELWSIFDFLMPDFLGAYSKFKEDYELPILRDRDSEKTERLRGQIMPFILRRLKGKVLSELPEKVETVVTVPMTRDQRKLYLSNLAKVKLEIGREIREGGFESNKIQILAMLTRLRQLCCHPALCYDNYSKESGKLEACLELIREAAEAGRRVLVFSQFTSMFPLIGERLNMEGVGFYTLTGKTPKQERQVLVKKFNEGDTPVFLISLKAGGTGLNLTGADVVIHYDPWWNQAAEAQATDRAHRLGQKNCVQVYKLVTKDTIEEKIVKLQQSKEKLADSVIGENGALLSALNEEQLQELFR